MNYLREQMKLQMDIAGYCQKTQQSYIRYVKDFYEYRQERPSKTTTQDIENYLYYLMKEKKLSVSYINGAYSALKFFYERTLKRNWQDFKIPRIKGPKKLPYVLSGSEVMAIIEATNNLKHTAILMVTYSAGLRISEAAALKVSDIDSKRMQIRVNQGKGKKDRCTILSEKTLEILRDYYKFYRPKDWLFPGVPPEKPISTRSIQRIFEYAKEKVGIKKPVSVHTLRHSFATHLLETGTDISYIQHLLGHNSLKTTSVYIHLKRKDVLKIISPLDNLFK